MTRIEIPDDLAGQITADIAAMGNDAPLSLKRLWGYLDAEDDLVTRSEMAALRDVHISTLMTWMVRYPDFPGPVQGDRRSWAAVRDYLNRKGLPRMRHKDAEATAATRDARILDALRVFPDGLTVHELAELIGEDEPASVRGEPTPLAVRVRLDDRLRRLEAAGKVTRTGLGARGTLTWKAV